MTVARWGPDSITTTGGVPIPNLPITINVHGGGLATLYTDESGLTTTANPTTTDSEGNLQFFAATGDYDIVGNGATITVTLGGSGGGSITLIESLDSSVTVTNGAGPTVNLSVPPGGVTSVTAADSTLTITPTTGAVTAKIPSSVALPGSPTTTTQSALDNSTKVATTAYTDSAAALKAPIASPTFTGTVTVPNGSSLGTPTSLTLTNATGLPESGVTNLTTDLAAKLNRFVPAAVATSASVSIAANTLVPFDTTSNAITATLPNAPADGTVVGVKLVTVGAGNTVTYNCAGSDVFNKTGGPTTGTLSLSNQAAFYEYKASGAIWYNIGDDIPLSQLDARYASLVSPAFTGTPTAPTASAHTANTQLATTAYVDSAVAAGANQALYLSATYR